MAIRLLFISTLLLLSSCSDSSDPSSLPSELLEQNQFMIANAARENVSVTTSGLQYEVLRAADGAKPNANSVVTVHYAGTLTNGTVFDSSYTRGEPATFVLSGTIKGWIEGVQLMNVGSQYRFVIPAELAYGDRGSGTLIGPGDTLIFEIELLQINSS